MGHFGGIWSAFGARMDAESAGLSEIGTEIRALSAEAARGCGRKKRPVHGDYDSTGVRVSRGGVHLSPAPWGSSFILHTGERNSQPAPRTPQKPAAISVGLNPTISASAPPKSNPSRNTPMPTNWKVAVTRPNILSGVTARLRLTSYDSPWTFECKTLEVCIR